MRFEFVCAIRFLRAIKHRKLIQFTASAAIAGIACGVAATVFANALANGFRQEIQIKILNNTAHIVVTKSDGAAIFDWQNLIERIEKIENVKTVAAANQENVLIIGKTNSAFATLRGLSSVVRRRSSVEKNDKPRSINNGQRTTDNGQTIEIGKELAERLNLKIGDAATIVSSGDAIVVNGEFNRNFMPVSATVEVAAILSSGFYEVDSGEIRASLADAAQIAGKNEISIGALEIRTADVYNSNQIATNVQNVLGADYAVADWQETNRNLFAALSLERRVALVIVALVAFVAVLNVTTTLALVTNERRADIAILKTCGARRASIVRIFLLQGAILSAVGAVSGILLGLIVCAFCNRFDLISLPPDVYSVNTVVLQPASSESLIVGATAFLLGLIASAFPALIAANVKPLETLRN